MKRDSFYKLMLIIFNQTFGIKKNKNEERYGATPKYFPTYQLGRDLRDINSGNSLKDASIYIHAIDDFFQLSQRECVEKTIQLFERLSSEGYITGISQTDITLTCNAKTLGYYKDLLVDIWNNYYNQYLSSNSESFTIYNISLETLKAYVEFPLPNILDYYKTRTNEYVKIIKTKDPSLVNIDDEYINFFKSIIEKDSFDKLSSDEKHIFYDSLYALSDILDKKHHKDSYEVNLALLTYYNKLYGDNYFNAALDDVRKIQGCVYSIAINKDLYAPNGSIRLTSGKNLICDFTRQQPINYQEKYNMCLEALENLLNHAELAGIHASLNDDIYLQTYENKLEKRHAVNKNITQLVVLSLIYSNLAAIHIQFLKNGIGNDNTINEHTIICEDYHERSRYIRTLIIRIQLSLHGKKSNEYADSVNSLANYYHSLATRYYYQEKYAHTIIIRSVLYQYYRSINAKEKANMQLTLSPISAYEINGGTSKLYESISNKLFNLLQDDFAYLNSSTLFSYEDFKALITQYQEYKSKF